MNILDLLILIPVVWGCIRGFSKGLILELTSLIGLIVAILAARYFAPDLAAMLNDYVTLGAVAMKVLANVLIFVAVMLLFWLIGWIITKVADLVLLGWLNKLLGAVFGLLKGVVIAALLLMIVVFFDKDEKVITRPAKEKSMFYQALSKILPDQSNSI
jgi:membrane protein required for colicin V production